MKRFISSLAGKTILFILCITSICVFTASICGIVFYTQDYMKFYMSPEEDVVEEYLVEGHMRSYGYSVLWNALSGPSVIPEDFCYRIKDADGGLVAEYEYGEADAEDFAFTYGVLRNDAGDVTDIFFHNGAFVEDSELYTVSISLIRGTGPANEFAFLSSLLHIAYMLRYAVFLIALISMLSMIVSFIALMTASGHRPGTEELYPGPLHRVPFDLLLVFCGVAGLGLGLLADGVVHSGLNDFGTGIFLFVLCLTGLNIVLGLCMSAAGRIKQHTILQNTVICRILKVIRIVLRGVRKLIAKLHGFNVSLVRGLPLIWKTGLTACGLSLLELIVIAASDGDTDGLILLALLEKLLLIPALLYLALTLRRLQKSGTALAGGDLSYHTDTRGMLWDFKQHGENLNSIAGGMTIAVEERMKSERMKTELITNVSHDIKTPLTSIINYASLIGGESCDNPKITEYSEVLVRQSEKLKRLIEDLVEASKASTGSLDILLSPCDAAVFLTQAGGEYEEKLQQSELSLIIRQPEKELRIMADGRRMWRIFDNLMNNICKYAQPGTRVYLSLEELCGHAVITFKNTSRDPLDMSEQELMERFTRGDSSRHTEGNGLGLSIAKSMAELQGGSLRLAIDGDLFKAVLSFPLIRSAN